MAKVKHTMYLHSSKDGLWEEGEELGLSEEALKQFRYALYEVTFETLVDIETGEIEVLTVDPGDGFGVFPKRP